MNNEKVETSNDFNTKNARFEENTVNNLINIEEQLMKPVPKYVALNRTDFDMNVIDEWTQIHYIDPPKRRCYHISFIHKNILYVFGGMDINEGKMGDFLKLDLNNLEKLGKWTAIETAGAQPEALAYCGGVLVRDTYYLFGGENIYNNNISDLYVYDINENIWEKRIYSIVNKINDK